MRFSRTIFIRGLQKIYKKALIENNAELKKTAPKESKTINRKQFLRSSALIGASFAIPNIIKGNTIKNEISNKNISVAIIGAGISGLTAANTLLKAGIKATIYEASGRTGGRIYTAKDLLANKVTTELGGEFIDSNNKDLLDLIEEFNLKIYDCVRDIKNNDLDEHIFFFGGKKRTEEEIIKEFKKIIPTIQTDYDKMNDDDVKDLDKKTVTEYLKDLKVIGWFKDLLVYANTAEFGLDADELGCLNFIDMIGDDTPDDFRPFGDSDERYKIVGGNQTLIEKMTKKLNKINPINLKHQLIKISKQGTQYSLEFKNGTKALADYVLLTIPFSVLRDVIIDPNVNFSDEKKQQIAQFSYGTNSKLFLGMKERIWRSLKSSGYVLNEVIHDGWDSSQMQQKNTGAGGYTIFLGGKEGKELVDNDETVQKYLYQLETILKGTKQNYSNKKSVFNWSLYPFNKGSYACYKTGQWLRFQSKNIMKPVDNIYFAGEHCSEKFQGFMNGGAETGRMAAENIMAKILDNLLQK